MNTLWALSDYTAEIGATPTRRDLSALRRDRAIDRYRKNRVALELVPPDDAHDLVDEPAVRGVRLGCRAPPEVGGRTS